jgi:hypothetical protein
MRIDGIILVRFVDRGEYASLWPLKPECLSGYGFIWADVMLVDFTGLFFLDRPLNSLGAGAG